MSTVDIMCPHCGWRNPAWARMCGGCGQLLRDASPQDATAARPTPAEAHPYLSPSVGDQYPSPARTNASTPAYESPPPIGPAPAPGVAPTPWPGGAPPAPGRRSRVPGRVAVIALVALLVVILALLGGWAAIMRPAIHNQIDGQLRATLANTISQIPPAAPPNEYALSADTVNASIAKQIPVGSGIQSAEVHFLDGDVVLDYNYQGSSGTLTTQLVPQNGRLVAQNTTVTGPLGWVESGDEVQAALNAELPGIPSGYRITSLRTDNDTLIFRVNE